MAQISKLYLLFLIVVHPTIMCCHDYAEDIANPLATITLFVIISYN